MNELHPRLLADTRAIAETHFAWLRYMDDSRFAWLVIVPKRPGIREWFELDANDQQHLLKLVNQCSQSLQQHTGADKMNLGALGNLVPQLHIHIIARNRNDACWPGPVWGQGTPEPYVDKNTPVWVTPLQTLFEEIV
jgi:diadenosine tetraphosphate (Ap4A) HIT family hydrolase